MPRTNYIDIMEKNHMEIPWHDYTNSDSNALIANADLIEKASVIGRVGLIMLSCGTGAWRVRTSMNKLSKELGVTCTVDVGLMSIEFNCFDGNDCVSPIPVLIPPSFTEWNNLLTISLMKRPTLQVK